jgi:cytochrome c peroxidase
VRLGRCVAPALLILASSIGVAYRAAGHDPAHSEVRAPGYGRIEFEPAAPGSYALPPLGDAADGEVLDAAGNRARLHELYDDRIVLLSFIYSSCSDAEGCPLATAIMQQVSRRIETDPTLAEHARLVSLSFDPQRDTPEVMRAYGASFRSDRADWRFLTTASSGQLDPILDGYNQSILREFDEEGRTTGQLSHILRVFLIDKQKRIRNIYSSSYLHADVVISDIRTVLLDEAANGATSPAGAAPLRGSALDLHALAKRPPLGLPAVPVPEDNPLTREKIELGRKLFFDRRLSQNGTMSCAMCHIPEQGFTNRELATAVGIEGRTVRRNSPSLYNVAYAQHLFHDGRESRLERQIWGPLLAGNEMGNPSVGGVIDRIEALPGYAGLFEQAFDGRGPGMETLGMALASYQRTLLSANSPFDRWHFGGDESAVNGAAVRGFRLFSGKAACAACHLLDRDSALFTDHGMHNTGIGYRRSMGSEPTKSRVQVAPGTYIEVDRALLDPISESPPSDLGLYEVTQDPRDRWKYKTPSLRNATLSPPYMHDGSLSSLRDVVEFYNAGGIPNETLDPLIRPLGLSPREIDDLVAFLESLTGDSAELLALDARVAPIGDPR